MYLVLVGSSLAAASLFSTLEKGSYVTALLILRYTNTPSPALGLFFLFSSRKRKMNGPTNSSSQVVLANGDIVNANSQENSDLFQVLKGGGNNFGIVTRIDMETFDNNGLLWGGLLQYPSSTLSQHVKAFTHFTDNVENDPNASTIMFVSFNSEDPGDIGVFDSHVYTKPVVQPPAYDEYNAIPGKIFDTSRITNMSDLVAEVPIETGWR